jgi:hypothetical protein
MTIFRSKAKQQTFRITNSGSKPLHLMTELWCDEFTLEPGDILEGRASSEDLSDPLEPLNFEVFLEDDHVSLWCPYETEFSLKRGSEE